MNEREARRTRGVAGRRWLRTHALLAVLVAAIAACAPPPPLPGIDLSVDPTLTPAIAELPGFADGQPRPLAAITGEGGVPATFVADEVWLTTSDPSELAAFLTRWDGVVLSRFTPADYGLSDLEEQVLIRVRSTGADLSRLPGDLRALDPQATGEHRVSSTQALELLALTSRAAVEGAEVGVNWVGSGDAFRGRSTVEGPTGTGSVGGPYVADAFLWTTHSVGSAQDIGVGEAWRALDLAGKLGNRVKLAILDMGFVPDDDTPSGWTAISNVPGYAPIGSSNALDCGGSPCPWHGTNVASAAMAVPDNGYGAAGPGGPVAQPVLVHTLYDFFTSVTALGEARLLGARIANMSYSAPVPWYLGWSVLPFEAATFAFRTTGMLLFASAGNDGRDVDAEGCTLGQCWERTWHTPCENAGVICVGGLAAGSTFRAGGSNYGFDQVDIFGPYTMWLGSDPETPGNGARRGDGTSYSSPFVAGVAALVWAANPNLSAGAVEDILLSTAHPNGDGSVRRHVNALGAVRAALGNVAPVVTLTGGGAVPFNLTTYLSATVLDVEDAFPCCTVSWSSDVDGPLGTGWSVEHVFATLGSRVVTATATDSAGATGSASVTIDVVNVAPVVTLSAPVDGATPFRTALVQLRGSATDRNEPGEVLACSNLVWTSSVASDPFPIVGCEAAAAFASNGSRVLTLTATDGLGASDAASVTITVVDPPPDLPPDVQVTSPANMTAPPLDQPVTLAGTASDPEGQGPLAYTWTVQLGSNAAIVVGNAATVQWTPNQTFAFNQEGTYTVEVRLSVADPGGNVGSDFVVLQWVLIF
jgi:serine protease